MASPTLRQVWRRRALVLAAAALLLVAPTPARAAEDADCLGCHSSEGMTFDLPSGEKIDVHVDEAAFKASVHGGVAGCTDCHTGISEYPHPERKQKTRREYTLALYESCKQCHFEHYTRSLESMHYKLLAKGDKRAPVCVDCHGSHDIARGGGSRLAISRTCSRCHAQVYAEYEKSVHGRALIEQDNRDVPVCIDCHTAHTIADPKARDFRMKTPEMCGKCHADEKLMAKYGLSTSVLQSYLEDFHGVSIRFQRAQGENGRKETVQPVCVDCHGVHNIARADDPNSTVMKANLVKTCRQCHPEATENFPAAWLSHYEPSFQKAPLVYAISLFYWIFIPFMAVGLIVQIALHLWRVVINR